MEATELSALVSAAVFSAQEGQETLAPIDYPAIMPVLIILGAACVGVLLEAFLPRHQRWPPPAWRWRCT
jgi:NADH-quinone oxidoreductase subunit N